MDSKHYQSEIRLWIAEWREAKKKLRRRDWTKYIASLGFKDVSYISHLIHGHVDIHIEHIVILAKAEGMTPSEFLQMIETRLQKK